MFSKWFFATSRNEKKYPGRVLRLHYSNITNLKLDVQDNKSNSKCAFEVCAKLKSYYKYINQMKQSSETK